MNAPTHVAPCRVCGSTTGRRVLAFGRPYSRCPTCGTLQLAISEDDYRRLEPGYDPGAYLAGRSREEVRAFLKTDMRKALLSEALGWAGLAPEGLGFLDVGCGMGGYLLAAAELGMHVRGFEPSIDHGDVARTTLGFEVVCDYFAPAHVGDQRFDLIMLSHVIEHIYWPARIVEELLSVLAPGGCLIVITPNAQSLIARLCGARWPMLMPVDHVTMMGPDALCRLVPAGLKTSLSTSEYPSEFLATLGSVAKTALRGPPATETGTAPRARGRVLDETGSGSQLLRAVLAAGSFPFWLASNATGRAAALRLFVRKGSDRDAD